MKKFITRNELKSRLVIERTVVTRDGIGPICAYCGKVVVKPEMHEVFVPRGHVRMKSNSIEIFSEMNCVLLHPECHRWAATEQGKSKCARYLIGLYGKHKLIHWVMSLGLSDAAAMEVTRYITSLEEDDMSNDELKVQTCGVCNNPTENHSDHELNMCASRYFRQEISPALYVSHLNAFCIFVTGEVPIVSSGTRLGESILTFSFKDHKGLSRGDAVRRLLAMVKVEPDYVPGLEELEDDSDDGE